MFLSLTALDAGGSALNGCYFSIRRSNVIKRIGFSPVELIVFYPFISWRGEERFREEGERRQKIGEMGEPG